MILGGLPIMKIKPIIGGAFLLNTLLFGSYYAISKEVLVRVDPIVFSFCEMMTLVPPALIILFCSRHHITRQAARSGFVLGSCLCLGLFMLSVALRYNSATGTAFFPALNGLLAALFTWVFLRQPITKTTWLAGIVSVTGAFLLMANAGMGGIRAALIAFIGGLFCTMYIFLADNEQKNQTAYWPLFAIELLTMALWGNLIALLFGDWNMVHFELPKDALVLLYIGLGTVFLPTLITVLLQKYISPVTVSFISILEPILGAIVAYLYLHEVLPFNGYLGGGLIVAGVFIHTWGSQERVGTSPTQAVRLGQALLLGIKRFHTSGIALLLYPLLCSSIGVYIVSRLGGFPPPVWRDLFQTMPQFSTMLQQGQALDVWLMVAQSLSWLIAWSSLLLMGGIATYHALEKLFMVVDGGRVLSPWAGTSPTPTPAYTDWQTQTYFTNLADGKHFPLMPKMPQVGTELSPLDEGFSVGAWAYPRPGSSLPSFSLGKNPTDPPARGQAHAPTDLQIPIPEIPTVPDRPSQIDGRLLKQMGYTPYSASTRPIKRKLDPVALQQRRFQRRIRLAHVETPKVTGPLLGELPATIEMRELYRRTEP
jgi:drug/metabolite transporter (DMT)-like permease